ncbi:Uu.00g019690.m01.CDS01 [Anthostomella pinea]|uniref:Uu.00g019690.m01.CDS01 n=1 Tax=Anthostomella pinea TaxID=933095 RepID=A0AAI8YQS5_9PEZI|nr:Uu.00g019690.m01.CDS01 [Anthostomella pinea]
MSQGVFLGHWSGFGHRIYSPWITSNSGQKISGGHTMPPSNIFRPRFPQTVMLSPLATLLLPRFKALSPMAITSIASHTGISSEAVYVYEITESASHREKDTKHDWDERHVGLP